VLLIAAFIVVYAFMIVEARRAAHNEAIQRARGGIEPAGDVYRWMQWAYPGTFLAMFVESALRGPAPMARVWLGAFLFVAGKALKWWAIRTLGGDWTFRVIVVPDSRPIRSGPYRWLRHPNYAGVIGELVGATLMTDARVAGPIAILGFGVLLARRIAVENRVRDAILRRT
jgi:methyltransferase